MHLDISELQKIYFLTHTSLPEKRIKKYAGYTDSFDELTEKIHLYRTVDLDRDWALFDFEYKKDKKIYADNIKLIDEKDIFRDTYIHLCKTKKKYLIHIIGESGFCRRCNTQFFPKLWWNHPKKNELDYFQIKYGESIKIKQFELNQEYLNKILLLGTDRKILEYSMKNIHSPYEIEKVLNTKYYDRNNPPPPSKIHNKLITLYNIWKVRPVKKLGIHNDSKFFFHKCSNSTERILFQNKYFYTWCPGCFTKFIPDWDKNTINLYRKELEGNGYYSIPQENNYDNLFTAKRVYKNSDEYHYLSILGLNDRVNVFTVNNTFRKLSKIYHPDHGGNTKMFQKIVKAKNWLLKYYKNLK